MRIYLDNCALNRPFDDQSHIRILKKLQGRNDILAVNPVDIVGEIDEYNN